MPALSSPHRLRRRGLSGAAAATLLIAATFLVEAPWISVEAAAAAGEAPSNGSPGKGEQSVYVLR